MTSELSRTLATLATQTCLLARFASLQMTGKLECYLLGCPAMSTKWHPLTWNVVNLLWLTFTGQFPVPDSKHSTLQYRPPKMTLVWMLDAYPQHVADSFGCYTLGCWYKYTVTVMYWIICILSIDCMSSQRTGRWQLEMLSFLEKLWGYLYYKYKRIEPIRRPTLRWIMDRAEVSLSSMKGKMHDGPAQHGLSGQMCSEIEWSLRQLFNVIGFLRVQCIQTFPFWIWELRKYRMSQFPLDRHGGTVSLAVM